MGFKPRNVVAQRSRGRSFPTTFSTRANTNLVAIQHSDMKLKNFSLAGNMTNLWEEIADSVELETWNKNEIEEDSVLLWISGPSGVGWIHSPINKESVSPVAVALLIFMILMILIFLGVVIQVKSLALRSFGKDLVLRLKNLAKSKSTEAEEVVEQLKSTNEELKKELDKTRKEKKEMMFAEKKFMEVLSLLLEGGELVVEKLDEAQTAIVEKVKVLMRGQVKQEENNTEKLKKEEKKEEMVASRTQGAKILGKKFESTAEKTEDKVPCFHSASIDNRKEHAMDLVKSHLMSAVRSEVDELKEKIAKLEDDLRMKMIENDYFRQHASLEVLQGVPLPPRPAPLLVYLGQ